MRNYKKEQFQQLREARFVFQNLTWFDMIDLDYNGFYWEQEFDGIHQ